MDKPIENGQAQEKSDWPKLVFIGLMYMAQTFPSAFASSFIPSMFRKQGVALESLWIFSLPLIPYWLRWAMGPVVDAYWIKSVGRRKSWFIPCTILAVIAYASIALFEPMQSTIVIIVSILFIKSVFTAVQEVAIDAYVVDNVTKQERPNAAALNTIFEAGGQMTAMIALGMVVDRFGWRTGAVVAALLMILFLTPAILRKEPPVSLDVQTALKNKPPGIAGLFRPLTRFLQRPDTWRLAPLYLISGLYTGLLFPMLGPFLVDLNYSMAGLGMVVGATLGLSTLVGATLTATLVKRLGYRNLLILLAVIAIPASLPAAWLAITKTQLPAAAMIAVLSVPTVVMAVFYVMFVTLRIGFASTLQAATDYASAAAITRIGQTVAAAASGPIAAALGWHWFFLVLGGLGVVVMSLWAMSLAGVNTLVARRNELEVAPQSPGAV
jgi:MFS family permease